MQLISSTFQGNYTGPVFLFIFAGTIVQEGQGCDEMAHFGVGSSPIGLHFFQNRLHRFPKFLYMAVDAFPKSMLYHEPLSIPQGDSQSLQIKQSQRGLYFVPCLLDDSHAFFLNSTEITGFQFRYGYFNGLQKLVFEVLIVFHHGFNFVEIDILKWFIHNSSIVDDLPAKNPVLQAA
jgi:hypothetical protein